MQVKYRLVRECGTNTSKLGPRGLNNYRGPLICSGSRICGLGVTVFIGVVAWGGYTPDQPILDHAAHWPYLQQIHCSGNKPLGVLMENTGQTSWFLSSLACQLDSSVTRQPLGCKTMQSSSPRSNHTTLCLDWIENKVKTQVIVWFPHMRLPQAIQTTSYASLRTDIAEHAMQHCERLLPNIVLRERGCLWNDCLKHITRLHSVNTS